MKTNWTLNAGHQQPHRPERRTHPWRLRCPWRSPPRRHPDRMSVGSAEVVDRRLHMACDGYFICFVLRLGCQQQHQHFRINVSFTASLCVDSSEIVVSPLVGKLLKCVSVRGFNIWRRGQSRNRCVERLVTHLKRGKNTLCDMPKTCFIIAWNEQNNWKKSSLWSSELY